MKWNTAAPAGSSKPALLPVPARGNLDSMRTKASPSEAPQLSSATPFELLVAVQPDDIDELGHVNNTVYLRWVQDVATAHWRTIAPAEAQTEIMWVVVRHEIDYLSAARLRDQILLRTWVGVATRATFERHTEILRANDPQPLARVRTLWCPIDARTHRPRRVNAAIRAQFSVAKTRPEADRAGHKR